VTITGHDENMYFNLKIAMHLTAVSRISLIRSQAEGCCLTTATHLPTHAFENFYQTKTPARQSKASLTIISSFKQLWKETK
jgi:hypothetical protein